MIKLTVKILILNFLFLLNLAPAQAGQFQADIVCSTKNSFGQEFVAAIDISNRFSNFILLNRDIRSGIGSVLARHPVQYLNGTTLTWRGSGTEIVGDINFYYELQVTKDSTEVQANSTYKFGNTKIELKDMECTKSTVVKY